jgi:hypothetical protein
VVVGSPNSRVAAFSSPPRHLWQLPTLNNLLENREMTLEDGRLLLGAERFDELLERYTAAELDARKLVRVSPGAASVAPCNLLFWLGFPYATSVLVTKY